MRHQITENRGGGRAAEGLVLEHHNQESVFAQGAGSWRLLLASEEAGTDGELGGG